MAWSSKRRLVATIVVIAILVTAAEIVYLNSDAYLNTNRRAISASQNGSIVSAKPHEELLSTIKFDAANVTSLPNATKRNVFYNRLGKCGSRSLLTLANQVAKSNGVKPAMSSNFWDEHPDNALALAEMRKISRLKPPTLYNRHIHYLDFQKQGLQPPVYVNMIREPFSRFQSHFNYVKYGDGFGKVRDPVKGLSDINKCVMNEEAFCTDPIMMDYYTNYFCGFDPVCSDRTSTERVELAKKHIRDNYLVIGLTEEFENTVGLLEAVIPEFFRGARKKWEGMKNSAMRNGTKTKTKDYLSDESVVKLRKVMHGDILVYEEAKSKYQKLLAEYGIIH